MEKVLQLQISIFGGYANFKPTHENVGALLDNFKEDGFVTSMISMPLIGLGFAEPIMDNRLQLITMEKMWNISFLHNRIDVNFVCCDDLNKDRTINNLLDITASYIKKIVICVPDLPKGNRLAVNCKILWNKSELNPLIDKICIPVKSFRVYQDNQFNEWGFRCNSIINTEIKGENEACNCLMNMGTAWYNNAIDQESVVINLDINTIPNNTEPRFYLDDLIDFSRFANEKFTTILSDFVKG